MSIACHPPAVVRLSRVGIESSARAGLSNSGGQVDLESTTIQRSSRDAPPSWIEGGAEGR
jgi:hypothetical protein